MKDQPIIIAGMPRSGSSMISGIFSHHGCWVGTCREPDNRNAKGYFENLKIKDFMISHFGKPTLREDDLYKARDSEYNEAPDKFREMILDVIRDDGWEGGPWVAKFSCMYAPPVCEAFPEAKVYVPNRNVISMYKSAVEKTKMMKHECFEPHLRMRSGLILDYGARPVFFDDLISGEYGSVVEALEESGLTPDHDIIDQFVSPDLAHY